MKKITELTEQEILDLSKDDIQRMIKFRMAEEGIAFVTPPIKPIYFEVPEPTTKVYYCSLLGKQYSFEDVDELNKLLGVINECKTLCTVENNYSLRGKYKDYIAKEIKTSTWRSDEPSDTITPTIVYSNKEYVGIKDLLEKNSRLKEDYEDKLKDYKYAKENSKWIRDEIEERVEEVREKYRKLGDYVWKFENDYLPLADNNKEVAMNFLNKAYFLTEEEQNYVLESYKDNETTTNK